MLTTGCDGCCFSASQDGRKGCTAGQVCITKGGKTIAPGYCRMCRPHRWAKRQCTDDTKQLISRATEENRVSLELIVFFDEDHHTIDDLRKTLDGDWYRQYTERVIIADVTGFGDRKNIAMQYLGGCSKKTQIVADSSACHETVRQRGETIRRISKMISAPFFLAIPAGTVVNNFDTLAIKIQNVPSRVIHWAVPFMVGSTALVPQELNTGLFITAPYKALTSSPEAPSFSDQLRIESEETQMGLSWFCDDAWLI